MKIERVKVAIRGAVQGVGFRPFVYRLATEMKLCGWVTNSAEGVLLEIEGTGAVLRDFVVRLKDEKPARAVVQSCETSFLDAVGYERFEIRETESSGEKSALILPDIATCADCLRETFAPDDRRFRYPFTNCTNCGPRFSIIEALPYDRANTSMKKFPMCEECEREYHDPGDRRFHAQPTACPRCGPQLELWDSLGKTLSGRDEALQQAAAEIRAGKILALKGLGGFQLLVDARDEEAVVRLRERKHREEKPFAVLFPSLIAAQAVCEISELAERLLICIESPIVLVPKRSGLAPSLAPQNPYLGAMLPYTPLHHLLMRELDFPVVATSGNLSDEPICIDEDEARERLRGIADLFLVHDRPIVRPIDDSVARIMCGRELVMRRARGFAPLPISLELPNDAPKSKPVLALGAHLKNTVALRVHENVFVSQHIGDLSTHPAYESFLRAAADLPRLYEAEPQVTAHDLHPEYLSTKHALSLTGRHVAVQHHFAHIAACMAENEIDGPALGVSWDGTGYGNDGTIWGGEFLFVRQNGSFDRVAHLRAFRLPGGDQATKEPRRAALGLLHEMVGDGLWQQPELLSAIEENERLVFRQMLERKINAPLTSSAGRLFDAVAAIIGLRERASFEGQAAMALEFAADAAVRASYPFTLREADPMIVDWEPAISALLGDLNTGASIPTMAGKFHQTLVEMIVALARKVGEEKVVLSGGCFQNRLLTERTITGLRAANFRPYWHQRIPPNDGGISLGQIVAASWSLRHHPSAGARRKLPSNS
ncbi:MAG: carbamoyltransferase HypF [Chthoniobacterales bacterium]|nr:carbamoyltransferase HypF [Chthoniobacterales bacterium]